MTQEKDFERNFLEKTTEQSVVCREYYSPTPNGLSFRIPAGGFQIFEY